MKFTRKAFATSVIAAVGAVPLALAFSAVATAQPAAPAPVPAVPGLEQLANAPQMLQGMASAL
ncbi:hypothetical protein Q2100_28435, partial [Mycolicibacterium sp. KC 300]|nr:hypothetical protein [Mycolicibacterium arseniciresistens]